VEDGADRHRVQADHGQADDADVAHAQVDQRRRQDVEGDHAEHQHAEGGAEHVAHRDVRHVGDGDRGNAGGQFRQRCNCGHQHQSDPVTAEPSVAGDGVAVARQA